MISISDHVTDSIENLYVAISGTAVLDALMAGGEVLQQNTRQQLTREVAGATHDTYRKGSHWGRMIDGVKLRRNDVAKMAVVNIMGDFRLKFFERGTIERKRGNGHMFNKRGVRRSLRAGRTEKSTGKIKAKGFFAHARADEGPITAAITAQLDKLIK